MRKQSVVLPSVRIDENLLRNIDLIVKKEGFTSRAEFIRKALEEEVSEHFQNIGKPKSPKEILRLVYKRSGGKPKIKRNPKEVFEELYKEEGLL